MYTVYAQHVGFRSELKASAVNFSCFCLGAKSNHKELKAHKLQNTQTKCVNPLHIWEIWGKNPNFPFHDNSQDSIFPCIFQWNTASSCWGQFLILLVKWSQLNRIISGGQQSTPSFESSLKTSRCGLIAALVIKKKKKSPFLLWLGVLFVADKGCSSSDNAKQRKVLLWKKTS